MDADPENFVADPEYFDADPEHFVADPEHFVADPEHLMWIKRRGCEEERQKEYKRKHIKR